MLSMKARTLHPLTNDQAAFLMFFRTEVEGSVGWCREGVRGWRFRLEAGHPIPNAYRDAIKHLRAWGLLVSSPVAHMPSDPLLRISSDGAGRVNPGGEFHARNPALHQASYFLSLAHEWVTLQSFCAAREERTLPLRFGRRGWQSIFEARRYGHVDAHSAANLARIGLLEQRREIGSDGKRVLYSRASASGMRLVIVGGGWYGEKGIERAEAADERDAENLPDCPW